MQENKTGAKKEDTEKVGEVFRFLNFTLFGM